MSKKLSEIEPAAAALGGERRSGLRVIVSGRALFLFAGAPKEYPRRDGQGITTIVSAKVWTPRGDALWIEVRDAAHIALVQGMVEGEILEFAGQLVVKARKLGGLYVTIRVFELQRP
ncbi:MAG: hypothetical protein M3P38_05360 [Chloroflexota bacterium]|nr:hypothetical protein [Chloroflexota bacterium]